MKIFLTIAISTFFSLFAVNTTGAATFTVTNINDSGVGSLRQAVLDANATEAVDTINFDTKTFGTPKTITLTTGQITINLYSLNINGPGSNLLTISGNNQSRIFFNYLFGSSTTNINNLTLTQGAAENGGAIYSNGVLNLTNLIIIGNKAAGATVNSSGVLGGLGGGIYSSDRLTITNSIVSNNLASGIVIQNTNPNFGDYGTAGGGGGIFSNGFSTTIVNCTFTNNMAKGISSPTAGESRSGSQGGSAYGGAVYGIFRIDILNSTFTNNSAVAGDGASIVSTTFGFTAGNGGEALGGVLFSSASRILNSTFNNNSALGGNGGTAPMTNAAGNGGQSIGGGILDYDVKIANSTIVNNSVTAGNGRTGADSSGGGVSGGSNQWSIVNSTITENSVTGGTGIQTNGTGKGGGVFSGTDTGQASFFRNNIVADNNATNGTDVFGNFINAANNLIRIGEGSTGITNGVNENIVGTASAPINPLLTPLTENGGLTKTRALLSGSPAINAGNNSFAINPFTSQVLQFDQRNFQRVEPVGGLIDIGAFELGASNVPVTGTPDLQNTSDTGLSNTDNITKATMPIFDVPNVIPGSTIELLRNNVVVSSTNAILFSVRLTDSNPPLDGVVQYTARQTIDGVASGISSPLTVTYDNTAPTVTINQASQQSDPATTQPIRFTAVFSETALGFDRDDIILTGSTADLSNAFVSVNATSSSIYNIEITGIRTPGQIIITVRDNAAYDFVLNYSSTPTYIDNNVTFQPNIVPVNVSGRIRRTSAVIKLSSTVTLTDDMTGESWSTRTNNFGYYRFLGLPTYQQIGRRFTVRIDNKSFNYVAPQQASITGNTSTLNYFVP